MGFTLTPRTPNPSRSGWLFRIAVRTLEAIGILIALAAFIIEFGYHKFEERTTRSWQLLATTASGNSGKIEALEYLNRQGVPNALIWLPFAKARSSLEGIELIPPILAEKWRNLERENRSLEVCSQFTYLEKVNLAHAILNDATLACSNLQDADLSKARLWKADLRGADLRGADFREADLQKAYLKEADLQNTYLERTNLRGVVGITCLELRRADSWAEAYRDKVLACGSPIPHRPPVDLRNADLQGVDLQGVDLQGADLQGADLRRAELGETILRGGNLQGAYLRGADLRGADLQEAILQEANLEGAYLQEA